MEVLSRYYQKTSSMSGLVFGTNNKKMWKKIITYTVTALAVIGVGVVLFSLIGVAVFLLPLLAGAFKK